MYDWNDLRHFLAVARSGSTVEAAKRIRVNQSTVCRRIVALETALGAKLFVKAASGYKLTELGGELVPAVERAEREAEAVLLFVEQRVRRLAGAIKVTTNETIAELFLMPALSEFAVLYPEIRVDVDVSSRWLDLAGGEADVALRAARHRGKGSLVGRKLSKLPWAIYCSLGYIAAHGRPESSEELHQHRIISVEGSLTAVGAFEWLEQKAGSAAVVARTNSLPNLVAAVRAGLGVSALPCVRGEAYSELVRSIGPNAELDSSLWLIVGRHNKDEPTIRVFSSFIDEKSMRVRHLLRLADDRED